MKRKVLSLIMIILMLTTLFIGCSTNKDNTGVLTQNNEIQKNDINKTDDKTGDKTEDKTQDIEKEEVADNAISIDENGLYSTLEDVAEYIHLYKKLPKNFISKKKAMELGWNSEKGNLWDITEKMSIGGDTFGNREGLLPKKDGRKYYECDVNYKGGFRGPERIVYSNDGLIYYTKDHYESFEKLY